MAVPLRARARRTLRSHAIRILVRLVSLLPLPIAFRVGAAAGALGHLLLRRTRALALRQLALAFPERGEGERRRIAREMFLSLGRAAAEVTAIRSYDHRLEAYAELGDPGLLAEVMARGKGMVYVTGHLGNWELMARRIARAGVPNAVIAKRGGDGRLMDLIAAWRAEGGVTTLWREEPDTGRAIIRTFRQGRALGILVDQDTSVQGVFVPFFGRLAHTPRAAGDLALRFGAPVVVGTIHRKGPRPTDGHLLELTEIPYDPDPADREAEVIRITAACQAVLEATIRRFPAEWVWMHQRWKTRPEDVSARKMPESRAVGGGSDRPS